jgi:hypothetical protein
MTCTGFAHNLQARLILQQHPQARSDHGMIIN